MVRTLAFLVAVATITPTFAAEDSIAIGGQTIKLSPPAGMVRCDGYWEEWDRLLATPLPPGNRFVALFAQPEDLEKVKKQEAPELKRYAMVQTVKAIEFREVGQQTFLDIRSEMKKGIDEALQAGNFEKAAKEADQRLDDAGENIDFGISDTKILGYFGDSEAMLGFSLAMKVSVNGEESKNIVSGITAPVNGRLVNFYVYSPFATTADRQWAEQTALDWKTAVVQANPQPQGPRANSGFDWKKVGKNALLYGIIGGIAGALGVFFKKRKESAS